MPLDSTLVHTNGNYSAKSSPIIWTQRVDIAMRSSATVITFICSVVALSTRHTLLTRYMHFVSKTQLGRPSPHMPISWHHHPEFPSHDSVFHVFNTRRCPANPKLQSAAEVIAIAFGSMTSGHLTWLPSNGGCSRPLGCLVRCIFIPRHPVATDWCTSLAVSKFGITERLATVKRSRYGWRCQN